MMNETYNLLKFQNTASILAKIIWLDLFTRIDWSIDIEVLKMEI